MMTSLLRVGTLGSAATFAGEATARLVTLRPDFGAPAYFPSMDACWGALASGSVDVAVLGVERTGQPNHGQAVIAQGFCVIDQIDLPLRCSLYVKPGARAENIRLITGHGSINQCGAWLDRHFPGVPRQIHALNSVAAAREVLSGDGSAAVIGSRSLPRVIAGLTRLAEDIDDGAVCRWWAVSATPSFSETADTAVLAGRIGPDGTLGALAAAMTANGFAIATAAAFPVDRGVGVYDYLLGFTGDGRTADLQAALARFPDLRLAGAFRRCDPGAIASRPEIV
jgi:chorismate mutase/prephenate dehydratase